MNEQATTFFPGIDRRSPTGFNRFRRLLNDYWLLPVLICYLQLATQVMYPVDSPTERLSKGNRAFLQGIPIAYQIATHEFPFTILGHVYEIGVQGFYNSDLLQVPHEDIQTALGDTQLTETLYQRLVSSRDHHESEIGGLLSISYPQGKPTLHLHEIPSLNEDYLKQLHTESKSASSFLRFLKEDQSKEILNGVGLRPEWIETTTKLIQNDRIADTTRQATIENFVEIYKSLSESRYILTPYQFKSGLGKIPFDERFIGIFHFHNGLNEPPSATDIQQSLRNRQLVFTFSDEGWTLYDVKKRVLSKLDIKIDKRIALQ